MIPIYSFFFMTKKNYFVSLKSGWVLEFPFLGSSVYISKYSLPWLHFAYLCMWRLLWVSYQSWASYLPALCLSFLICKTRIIIFLLYRIVVSIKQIDICKAPLDEYLAYSIVFIIIIIIVIIIILWPRFSKSLLFTYGFPKHRVEK